MGVRRVNKQEMRQILFELRQQMAINSSLDDHQRQSLQALSEEITRKIEDPVNNLSSDAYLLRKFKEETEEFENKHPDLTHVVGRLSDLLARMGI